MFRPLIRSLATLIAAIGVATCTEAPSTATSPAGTHGMARLAFEPVFSKAARAAAAQLADFGIDFDHVRVVIVRPVSDTVKDTTITFGPNSPDVTLNFAVGVQALGESFLVTIDYFSTGSIVFHGDGSVQSHAPDQPAPPQAINVQYTGPGAAVARVAIAPKTTSAVSKVTVNFTAVGFDASNNPVPGTPFGWSTSDSTIATISSSGILTTTGKRGVVTVTAITPTGISDNATVTVTLPVASITLVSGGGQTGPAGSSLPLLGVVKLTASDGVGVPGVPVTFAAPAGGAVGSPSVTTDASGNASTVLTLGSAVGPQSFAATALGLSVAIPETATSGAPAGVVVVSGSGQIDTVKHALKAPFIVKVIDQFGNPTKSAAVNWVRTGGTGALATTSTVTGADGTTSNTYTLGGVSGTETITASSPGSTGVATLIATALAGPPAAIATVSGGAQTATINHVLTPLVVKVTDEGGNPVNGATVNWTATNGTLNSSTVTDATGQTSNVMTTGTLVGTATATATIAGKSVTFTQTVQPGVAAKLAFQVNPPTSTVSQVAIAPPVRVALLDFGGNVTTATAAVTIALGANPGGGLLSGTLTRNAVAGVVTFDDLKIDKAGTGYTFVASGAGAPNLTSTPFNIVAGPAATLATVTGEGQTATIATAVPVAPSVRITDLSGNPVAGASVTFTPSSGAVAPTAPVLTNALGVAALTSWTLGTVSGPQRLVVTAAGVPNDTIHATALPGPPAKLAFQVNPPASTVSQVVMAPAVRVALLDAGGNVTTTTGAVTIALGANPGEGSLTGTLTRNAVAGIATFDDLKIDKAGTGYILVASSAGAPNGTSTPFNIVAGPAVNLVTVTGEGQTGTVVTAASVAPSVRITDLSGNPVTGASVTFTPLSGGAVAPTGPVLTNALGVAALTSWTFGTVSGPQLLLVASAGVPTDTIHATALPGPPAKLAFAVNPSNAVSAVPFSPTIVVRVLDANGNAVTNATTTVSLGITSGTGPPAGVLAGTTTVAAINGLATFPGLSISTPFSGYSLTATSTGLTSAVSPTFAISALPPILTLVSPAAVDAVFSTVPVTITGSNFLSTTSLNLSGGLIVPTNIAVQDATTITANFNITGGAATSVVALTATSSSGPSNGLQFNVYSVGSAPLQLGPLNGDSGGNPYSLDCPVGSVATGLNVRGGSNVDNLQVICQPVTGSGRAFGSPTLTDAVGGGGGSPATLSCPSNYVLIGISGRIGSGGGGLNDLIAGTCGPIGGGAPVSTSSVGSVFSGSIDYTATCPVGLALVGIQGGAGSLLDRTQIKCQ